VSPEGRVWQLTEELRAERAHSDEMRIELETSQRELKRALRREECAAAAVVAEGAWAELQIKMMAQRHKVRHPINENRAPPPSAHCSPTPQPTSATQKEKPKLRAAARDTARSRNQAATEFVKVCAAYLRQEREMRPQPQRGAAGGGGKRSAEVDAAAAARRVGDLETALKRVRGSQQHTLLDTREEKKANIAELSWRRKATAQVSPKTPTSPIGARCTALATEKVNQGQCALSLLAGR
jgi:hypothetical protein